MINGWPDIWMTGKIYEQIQRLKDIYIDEQVMDGLRDVWEEGQRGRGTDSHSN